MKSIRRPPYYFDYAATTRVDPAVWQTMMAYNKEEMADGNASSTTHDYGRLAAERICQAQQTIQRLFHAPKHEVIFTSGATESINLALKGVALAHQQIGNHIITVNSEHNATLDTCRHLESLGFQITYLPVDHHGLISLSALNDALQENTQLVSIMHVNNETGVVQDIQRIGQLLQHHPAYFHVDGAQSAGKLPVDLEQWQVDLFSLTAHKCYGPKGIGALLKHRHCQLMPQIHGGSQQYNTRAGTLPTAQIIGLEQAMILGHHNQRDALSRLNELNARLWTHINSIDGLHRHGNRTNSFPGIVNLRIDGINGDALLMALHDIALSQGAACSSSTATPSHVLSAMGLTPEQCQQSIRLSFGRFTTIEDIDFLGKGLSQHITKLRQLAAFWQQPSDKHDA